MSVYFPYKSHGLHGGFGWDLTESSRLKLQAFLPRTGALIPDGNNAGNPRASRYPTIEEFGLQDHPLWLLGPNSLRMR